MAKEKKDPWVKCPFYRRETSNDIRCEACVGDTNISYFFKSADKDDYKKNYCSGHYDKCPLYVILEKKYL